MKLAILAPKNQSESSKLLIKEAKKLFTKVDFIPLKEITLEIPQKMRAKHNANTLSDYDYILPRIDSKRAPFGYTVVKMLDLHNIKKPYPAETVLISHNKFSTVFELAKARIPIPRSKYTASKLSASNIIDSSRFPLVIKLVSSFGGKGVLFASTETAANSVVKTLDLLKQDIMIEEFIQNPGEDIRAFVVGKEVIASMKRIAKEGDRRANLHSGGAAEQVELSAKEKELAIRSAKAIKAKICAIDMVRGPEGTVVIETNINPGLGGITRATGVNVARKIIEFCKKEAKK